MNEGGLSGQPRGEQTPSKLSRSSEGRVSFVPVTLGKSRGATPIFGRDRLKPA
jgi:hypothetical protein